MPPRRDYSRANYDEIRAKLNEIDWAVEFSDKNVNECYKIFLKFHEEIIEECVPKNIDKTEDERKRMKQKQKWLNWKVKSALRKRDDSWLNWKRHKSNENLLIYHKMRNNATNIKREAKMLEECKVIERIKENKNNFYKFIRSKTKRREQLGAIQKQDGTFTKCDQETAEVLNSEFQKVFTKIAERRIERLVAK